MPIDPKDAKSFNPRAIFSKTGKGVQEASGKTSHLSRADRAVLSAIDGKTMLSDVQGKFEKLAPAKFDALIQQLDKDGFIREVSSGFQSAPPPPPRAAAPAAKAPAKAPPPPDEGDDMDFTQAVPIQPKAPSAPKAPPVDLAAAARADAERRAAEKHATDFRAREEAEARAKAEAEAKARAAAEARAVAEAKARAEAESRARVEAEAKVKAAREAAVRLATEAKAKGEAEGRAKAEAAEKEKARLEAELNAKLEAERKAREEAERRAAEAAETARKELEEKAKRDAEELRQRLEAEMKAKLEAERKAREEEDRKRREEDDRRRKEEDERRAKEEAEHRKQREEEDRKRREDDERRRKEDQERRAKEEAERKKRHEEDDRRRKEEDERRALEDTNRRLEADRRAKEDAERRARQEAEAKARAAADAAASMPKIEPVAPPPPPPAASGGGFGDSLLADLDSFGKREEEEQREKEEAERRAKAEAERRAKEEAERRAKDEAEKKRREEEERRRREEEERRAKEESERREREEEERRKEEEAERKRKAKEAQAAKQAEERAAKAAASRGAARKVSGDEDDIPVTDEDLDTDDLKRDQKVAAERARKVAHEAQPVAVAVGTGGGRKKWGKPVAIALFALLVVGVGVLNFMPVSTAEYEKAASDAMGVPVKIASGRLSVLTGIEVKLEGVQIGSAKIRTVRGSPEIGSLFGGRKSFSRIDLEGVQLSQAQIGDALLGKVAGENFRVGRVTAKQLVFDGPLKLPALDIDAAVGSDGTFQTVKLAGPDKLSATLTPKGSDIGFEISAASIAVPFVPALNLSEFSMKGTANRTGVVSSEFDGRAFDGVLTGNARILWGDNWTVEGEVKPRNLKVAVFAPTLVSEGRVEGRAAFRMSGSAPGSLHESARMQGEFKIDKGVLGSFDVARALQTGGLQSGGRTVFNEMTGQGVYDKGAMQFTNVIITAGALNAGASLSIDTSGGISGRIVADVKTASQKQSATLNISGKVQDPVLRK